MTLTISMIEACKSSDLEKLKQLCHAGADIQRCNEAVRMASRYGHLEVVKYLCEASADIRI